jgi:hypothetical protein
MDETEGLELPPPQAVSRAMEEMAMAWDIRFNISQGFSTKGYDRWIRLGCE